MLYAAIGLALACAGLGITVAALGLRVGGLRGERAEALVQVKQLTEENNDLTHAADRLHKVIGDLEGELRRREEEGAASLHPGDVRQRLQQLLREASGDSAAPADGVRGQPAAASTRRT